MEDVIELWTALLTLKARLRCDIEVCLFCASCIDKQEQLGTGKRGERHRFSVVFFYGW